MIETAALWINLAVVTALVGAFWISSVALGPKRKLAGAKAQPYETGMPAIEPAAANMTVAYHRYAVLFVIFDIDLAFLAPWVLLRDRLDLGAMIAASVFLALVGLTLAYVWRKGVLDA